MDRAARIPTSMDRCAMIMVYGAISKHACDWVKPPPIMSDHMYSFDPPPIKRE